MKSKNIDSLYFLFHTMMKDGIYVLLEEFQLFGKNKTKEEKKE